ncbi:hypothetical protein [Croceicoccus sp. BE223]|uniref:hypothetical protein n=1 Tax=Croceicoccus sp. BE223 TaxID=2817716 RepID=UPI002862261F|nr:hypothetical protein [Croceicoccus sp. BE223]MDR7100978.1 hypothetical protein [Croceicoccus sp. BE223]
MMTKKNAIIQELDLRRKRFCGLGRVKRHYFSFFAAQALPPSHPQPYKSSRRFGIVTGTFLHRDDSILPMGVGGRRSNIVLRQGVDL